MDRSDPAAPTIPFDEASLAVNRREPRKRRIVTVWNDREEAALKALAAHTNTEPCALIRAVVVGSALAVGVDVAPVHRVDARQLSLGERGSVPLTLPGVDVAARPRTKPLAKVRRPRKTKAAKRPKTKAAKRRPAKRTKRKARK